MTKKLTPTKREEYIQRLAERMRNDASTGLPDSVMKKINFKCLAVSAILELEEELTKVENDDIE